MATNKTAENDGDVDAYLSSVEPDIRREDSFRLKAMMERVSGLPARMWGDAMVGFGAYEYTYESGHSGRHFLTGFAPRKAQMSVYIMPGFDRYEEQLEKLGKHKTTKSCLYIKKLDDVDADVFEAIIADSLTVMRERYGVS